MHEPPVPLSSAPSSRSPLSPRQLRQRRLRLIAAGAAGVLALAMLLDWTVLRLERRARWMSALPAGVLQPLARLVPNDPAVLYALGRHAAERGEFARAAPLFKKASDLDPHFWMAKADYANALVDLNEETPAFVAAQDCLMTGSEAADVAPAMIAMGRMHLRRGELEEARSDAERALAARPGDPDAWLLRARAMEASGDWSEVRSAAEHVTRARPRLADGWVLLAAATLHTGSSDHGVAAARTAVRLDPHASAGQQVLGEALLARGRTEDRPAAEAALAEALRVDPKDAGARLALGELRLQEGRPAEATTLLKEALDERPELNEARGLLAAAARAAGDRRQAEAWGREQAQWSRWTEQEKALRKKLDSEHFKSETRFALARLYFRMGLWKKGNREVAFGLQVGPDPVGLALREEYRRHEAAQAAARRESERPRL